MKSLIQQLARLDVLIVGAVVVGSVLIALAVLAFRPAHLARPIATCPRAFAPNWELVSFKFTESIGEHDCRYIRRGVK